MRKIFKQDLGGDEIKAKDIVKYTWEKDEIAYYYCSTFREVFKVEFTGQKWFLLSRWGDGRKIYQYKYLECSDATRSLSSQGDKGISHGEEDEFYTTKEEAIERGIRSIEYHLKDAIEKHDKDLKGLLTYANGVILKPCIER